MLLNIACYAIGHIQPLLFCCALFFGTANLTRSTLPWGISQPPTPLYDVVLEECIVAR